MQKRTLWNKFIVVEKRENCSIGCLDVVYDRDTKLMYYIISGGYRGCITPIYNADGTIKVYEGEE